MQSFEPLLMFYNVKMHFKQFTPILYIDIKNTQNVIFCEILCKNEELIAIGRSPPVVRLHC